MRRDQLSSRAGSSSFMNPFVVLGVDESATEQDLRQAWRHLAVRAHPDAGGSHEQMTQLNQALHLCLIQVRERAQQIEPIKKTLRPVRRRIAQEMSSFTVNVLPVECWHALEIVAATCGPTIAAEPPYLLEFFLQDSPLENAIQSWCRCDLVPEAGSTTVHVTVGSADELSAPELDNVRDFLVAELNELDWSDS